MEERVDYIKEEGLFRRERKIVTMTPKVEAHYHVRYLARPPLRTSYDSICRGLLRRIDTLGKTGDFDERQTVGLAVDATGVGRGPVDMLRSAINSIDERSAPRVFLAPIQVTSGSRVSRGGGFINVPKTELINSAVILLQEGRLKIAADVTDRDVLIKELLDYRVKINISTGNEFYEPWREGQRDDLLFSLCLATWSWRRTKMPKRLPVMS
jgi:hypothetical protein